MGNRSSPECSALTVPELAKGCRSGSETEQLLDARSVVLRHDRGAAHATRHLAGLLLQDVALAGLLPEDLAAARDLEALRGPAVSLVLRHFRPRLVLPTGSGAGVRPTPL